MEETTIDQKALEDAILKALPSLFQNLGTSSSNPRVEFYDQFGREADEHDRDFTKKCDDDLNTTLIFAGLFSAIATSFIVDLQKKLEPDYQEMGYTVLEIIANSSLQRINNENAPSFPQWNGPDPTNVHVLAILYTTLAISLLAAFIAMLGKQWLNRYGQTETHGSVIDRSRDRQRKMKGMVTWHFALVMECLPLMLQVALLLLSYAIFNYLFPINKVVAYVAIGFAAFSLLFYFLIVAAATFSYNCPFQTPLSRIFRLLFCFDNKHKKKSGDRFGRISSWKKKWSRPRYGGLYALNRLGAFSKKGFDGHIAIPMAVPSNRLPSLFNRDKEVDLAGYVLDSKCIAWMFEKSTNADVIMAIMRFIPEIDWHPGIQTTPLERLYDTVLECFDLSSKPPVVFPKLRNKAYLSAKALLHLAIQRKCIDSTSDEDIFESISCRYQMMGSGSHGGDDADLKSTLGILDRVFGSDPFEPIPWQNFSFTPSHHAWMGHILLYRAWDAINNKHESLPEDVERFILHSLRSESSPPAAVLMDCLSIIGLTLGAELHTDDSQVIDISRKSDLQIDKIYEKLTKTFNNPTPAPGEIDRALEAMKLLAPLSQDNVAKKSYNLFCVIMQAPISTTQKKWDAARLTLRSAYRSSKSLPRVEDPQYILAFLTYHFDVTAGGRQYQDEPIQDALCALAYASSPAAIESLERFNPKQSPKFVPGICYAYEDNKPFQLRKAAFFLLPFISDKWFDTHPIMELNKMKRFCADWASTMDEIGNTDGVKKAGLTVLFGMVNSPHWRPHIVTEKLGLLEYFALVPGDSQPLKKCINNPELMDAMKDTPAAAIWLKILWLKHGELKPEVSSRLETFTRRLAQSRRRSDLDGCQSAVDSELKMAEEELTWHSTFSQDSTAVALRMKVKNLERARTTLASLKKG